MPGETPKLIQATRSINILGSIPTYVGESGLPPDPNVYALDLDPVYEQRALVGNPVEFNGLGTEISCEVRVLFHATPGTDNKYCWAIKSDEPNAIRAWQFGLRNVSGTLRLWAWMSRATTAGGAANGVLDFRYTWTPTLETWYTIRLSVDLAGETAYAIIDGTPNAMSKAENGSGTYLADAACPCWIGFQDTIYANIAISHLMLAEDYTATQDTATYPLLEEPDHTDYDLTGIFAYWKCQEIVAGVLTEEVSGNNAILLPFAAAADFEVADTERVVVSDAAALDITGDLGISTWFKLETLPGAGVPMMPLGKWGPAVASYYLLVYLSTGYRFKVLCDSGSGDGSTNLIGGESIFNAAILGEWHHLLGTIDVSARLSKIFLDGVELTRVNGNVGSGNAIHAGTADIGIGGQANGSNYWDGLLSKTRLFDYYFDTEAKATAELVAAASAHANLVEEWPLEEDFDGVNGNNGTATGGTIPFASDTPPVLIVQE